MTVSSGICSGNVRVDRDDKQWLVGAFRETGIPLYDPSRFEVGFTDHRQGACRPCENASASPDQRSLTILLHGRFQLSFLVDGILYKCLLEHQGDYVLWEPRVLHWWESVTDSTVITIRWPAAQERE